MSVNFLYNEKTTPTIRGTFKDIDGNPLSIETLAVTIYDSKTKKIINSRDNQGLTIASYVNGTTGVLTFPLTVDDMTISRTVKEEDIVEHVVRFDFTWSSGTKQNDSLIAISIKDLPNK